MFLPKKIITVILSCMAVSPVCGAQYRSGAAYEALGDSETVTSLKGHVSFLSSASLDGRLAGSEGEKEAARYMERALQDRGIVLLSPKDGEVFGMKMENGDTLTSRNVVGFIPGYDREQKEHYIVIGARLDNLGGRDITVDGTAVHKTFFGANGNASGLAILLELASRLNTNSILLKRSVLLVGFGASLQSHAGAWYFLNRSFPAVSSIDAMIDLDMLGTGSNGFYAYCGDNVDLQKLVKSLEGTLQPITPSPVPREPCDSDHRTFIDSSIPSILFTTGRYPEYMTDRDTPSILQYEDMERELEYIYNFTVSLAGGPKPVFDRSKEVNERRASSQDRPVPYYECDRRPTFLGSGDPKVFLQKWVYQYLKYPQGAVSKGIQGRVLVDFIIDESGKVRDVTVRRGVHELLDAEALRVISASPAWKPGVVGGKKVKTEISLYVEFRLEKKK